MKFWQRKMRQSLLVEDGRDEMGTRRYHPMPVIRGPSSYGTKASAPPTGAPHVAMDGRLGEEKLFLDSVCIRIPCPYGTSKRWAMGFG